MRALRVDKMTLAALEATLRLALDPALGGRRIPLWAFLTTPLDALHAAGRAAGRGLPRRAGPGRHGRRVDTPSSAAAAYRPSRSRRRPSASARPFPAHLGSEAAWARALRARRPPGLSRASRGGPSSSTSGPSPRPTNTPLSAVRGVSSPRLRKIEDTPR